MIWPFRPRSPMSLPHKVACERRFAKTAQLLEQHRVANSTVLIPTDLDAIIAAGDEDALPQRLFSFIRTRFPIAKSEYVVEWCDGDADVSHATNAFYAIPNSDSNRAILVHPGLKGFPYRLASVLATVCADLFVTSEGLDGEFVGFETYEVLPIFFGFGPVMANATLLERSDVDTNIESWEGSQLGTTNALQYGYTMALADWVLETNYGDVVTALRPDARETYTMGIRYLTKTSECYFDRKVFDDASVTRLDSSAERLESKSDSVLLGTLVDLMNADVIDDCLASPISELIRHTDEDINQTAAFAISRCQKLTRAQHDDLLITVESSASGLKRAALSALRPGFENDEQVKESLIDLLGKADALTADACIKTLLKYDAYPENLQQNLLKALARMVLKAGTAQLYPALVLLSRISPDPNAILEEHFADDASGKAILTELFQEMKDADASTE